MLKIKDSVEFARTSSALSLIIAALCFLTANLVDPAWAPGARTYLNEIAAAPNRYQASAVLNAVGALAGVFGLIGVLHLLRGRRVTLGQLGAGLILVLWVLDGAHWLINLVETVGAQDDPNHALTLLTAASQSPWAVLVDIAAVCGLIFGPVLLAVGLWRRRATSIWVPITLLLYTGVTFIPGGAPPSGTYQWRTSSQVLAVASSALLAVALMGLALRILSLPDDAWARWQPLPDAPRRRRTPSPADAGPPSGTLAHPRRR